MSDLVRRLESIEARLDAVEPTIARLALADVMPPRVAQVLKQVCCEFQITPQELMSRKRAAWVITARFVTAHLLRKVLHLTESETARRIHVTPKAVRYETRILADWMDNDPKLRNIVSNLEEALNHL